MIARRNGVSPVGENPTFASLVKPAIEAVVPVSTRLVAEMYLVLAIEHNVPRKLNN